MPNWCDNNLTVSGSSEEVERFVQENGGYNKEEGEELLLDFALSVPEPNYEAEEETDPLWWRIENWGTKWQPRFELQDEVYSETVQDGDQEIKKVIYKFETAWSPCHEWLVRTAPRYPELRFLLTFSEPDEGIGGLTICANGQLLAEEDGNAREYMNEDFFLDD